MKDSNQEILTNTYLQLLVETHSKIAIQIVWEEDCTSDLYFYITSLFQTRNCFPSSNSLCLLISSNKQTKQVKEYNQLAAQITSTRFISYDYYRFITFLFCLSFLNILAHLSTPTLSLGDASWPADRRPYGTETSQLHSHADHDLPTHKCHCKSPLMMFCSYSEPLLQQAILSPIPR